MRSVKHKFRTVRRLRAALLASSALLTLAAAPAARAVDGLEQIYGPLGTDAYLTGMSPNGRYILGESSDVTFTYMRGWIYANGAYTMVSPLAPGRQTTPYAINNDGNIWVGLGQYANGTTHMVRFENGVLTDLHTGAAFAPGGSLFGYDFSGAIAMSADTNVVAGNAQRNGGIFQAVRWTQATGTTGLGFLPGYTDSFARGISADGSTIVGYVFNGSSNLQAMVWTQSTGMTGLGFLPGGNQSVANAVNADGSVIVGWSNTGASASSHAYRWTHASGMQDLGILPGGQFSQATAVSADGSIIGGTADANGRTYAIRWTQTFGMQTLAQLLAASGVNLGGLRPADTFAMSADGKIFIGSLDNNGLYIARCQSAICEGLTTTAAVANSFRGQSAVGQTANAAISGALGTMQEYATQAYASQGSRNTPYSVFAYGSYDSDPVTSGTLGVTVDLPHQLVAGLAFSANYVKTDMVYDGNAKMSGGAIGAFLAQMPDAGFQWLVGASAMTLSGEITRGYLNGVSPTSSRGSTRGDGHGFVARAGWSFDAFPQTKVTPFASYTQSLMRFGGYTEYSGVFPAEFAGQKNTAQTGRLGADTRYTFAPNSWIWGTLAFAHRLDGGKAPDITGALIDAISMSVPGIAATKNTFEVGGGVRLPAFKTAAVTASLTASVPSEGVTSYLARVGLSQAF